MGILYTNTQLYRVMKGPFTQQEAPVENCKYDNWRLKHGADYCTENNTSCEGVLQSTDIALEVILHRPDYS